MRVITMIAMAVFLAAAAVKDFKTKRISVAYMTVISIALGVLCVITLISAKGEGAAGMLLGSVIGVCFFIVSKVTNEAVGYADSWMILLIGAVSGWRATLATVFAALLISLAAALISCMRRGRNKTRSIPFIPALAAAYPAVLALGFAPV